MRSVLLVDVVRDEIEASLNFKYSPGQIAELKKDVGEVWEAFTNLQKVDEAWNRRIRAIFKAW